ncbi:MAG: ATP-dependent Clp protease adaptor ClpS [Salinivirgaceae bacterium]|jgi:ATP-dependent Clp protease adaptor protein ClpS|nr:ATP-dependent Clp protease adaptor ClpS [Salinivirgaceae bacterium]
MTLENSNVNPKNRKASVDKQVGQKTLLLHNDDVNSFDFVIKSLVDVCSHKNEQAEQCAYITHYKGKCDIKSGTNDYLKPMYNILRDRGLSVTIE